MDVPRAPPLAKLAPIFIEIASSSTSYRCAALRPPPTVLEYPTVHEGLLPVPSVRSRILEPPRQAPPMQSDRRAQEEDRKRPHGNQVKRNREVTGVPKRVLHEVCEVGKR